MTKAGQYFLLQVYSAKNNNHNLCCRAPASIISGSCAEIVSSIYSYMQRLVLACK